MNYTSYGQYKNSTALLYFPLHQNSDVRWIGQHDAHTVRWKHEQRLQAYRKAHEVFEECKRDTARALQFNRQFESIFGK